LLVPRRGHELLGVAGGGRAAVAGSARARAAFGRACVRASLLVGLLGPGVPMARLPNILVTGTPGTGKSSHCEALCEAVSELRHVDVNAVAREEQLFAGHDAERDADILDDDKVVDALEGRMAQGGCVVDTHSLIDYFPERWFDLVVVLQTNNTVLFDRLSKRGYSASKIQENVQAEIMMVLTEEAQSSYAEEIVQILPSNTVEELESNVERIVQWLKAWVQEHNVNDN